MNPTVSPCPDRVPVSGTHTREANTETTERVPRVCVYRHTGHGLGGPSAVLQERDQKTPPVFRPCPVEVST